MPVTSLLTGASVVKVGDTVKGRGGGGVKSLIIKHSKTAFSSS